jgi:hypothetical protein
MAKLSIASVKALFQTGDRPTQADYVDLIDTSAAQATDLGTAGNNEVTITGIENTTIFDNFTASEWRSVKYVISLKKSTENKYYTTELTIVPDDTSDNVSEYGTVDNDGNIGNALALEATDRSSQQIQGQHMELSGQHQQQLAYSPQALNLKVQQQMILKLHLQ